MVHLPLTTITTLLLLQLSPALGAVVNINSSSSSSGGGGGDLDLGCRASSSNLLGLFPRTYNIMDAKTVLGPKLSPQAAIWYDGDDGFYDSCERWSGYAAPSFRVSVDVYTEEDVVETVRFATANDIPLLAQSATHGWSTTLAKVQGGLGINIRGFKKIDVHDDNTATVGGGLTLHEITDGLYKHGKQIPTGSCGGVGLFGALFGGGVGRLQGMHGLTLDQLVSARVVTATGSVVEASATNNPDLLWALKGAGHNFGIVTEAVVKVYDQVPDGKHYNSDMFFSKDKLEQVFGLINSLQPFPKEMSVYTFLALDPAGGGDFVLLVNYVYAGPAAVAKEIGDKFLSIGSFNSNTTMLPYNQLLSSAAFGVGDVFSAHGDRKSMWGLGIKKFDLKTMRSVATELEAMIRKYPDFSRAAITLESYSLQGMKAVPSESTAYPHRDIVHHVLFDLFYSDPALDAPVAEFARKLRKMLQVTSGFPELKVYVNYSQGDESQEAKYGELWRRQKLAGLKKKYDPCGVFNAYHAISLYQY